MALPNRLLSSNLSDVPTPDRGGLGEAMAPLRSDDQKAGQDRNLQPELLAPLENPGVVTTPAFFEMVDDAQAI